MSLPKLVPNIPTLKQWPRLFKATATSKAAVRLNLINIPTAGKECSLLSQIKFTTARQ
jgi:hypothetical protein